MTRIDDVEFFRAIRLNGRLGFELLHPVQYPIRDLNPLPELVIIIFYFLLGPSGAFSFRAKQCVIVDSNYETTHLNRRWYD